MWLNYYMLYIVSTPIGNLGDITLRALDVLRSVDSVVSEDTRKTGMLLKHFEISKPQISFYEGNEKKHLPRILGLLSAGKDVALVSNAGTPAVSDPGFTLVRAVLENDIEISAVPGPTALIMALVLSGLPVHSFTFRGFPPRKTGARQRFLAIDEDSPHTLIFYESPHRLIAFLEDARSIYGDRLTAVANDLTKKFEIVYRGTFSDVIKQLQDQKQLGEYTIVIEGKPKDRKRK